MSRSVLVSALVGALVGAAICRWWLAPEPEAPPVGDAKAAVAQVLAREDPLQRAAGLGELLPRLGAEDATEVAAAFDETALDAGSAELVLLGHWWADVDPEGAWHWTRTEWRADDARVLAAVVRSWAHQNPQAAVTAAASLRYPEQAKVALDAALSGWEESGRGGLEEWVQGHRDTIDRQRFGEILGRRKVLSLGAEKALAWAEAIEDPVFRREMRRRVASAAALQDPALAASWAESRIRAAAEAGERPTGFPRRIGTRWSRSDPEGAMAWLSGLPAGRDRDDGVTESMRVWLQRDPRSAVKWAKDLEPELWSEPARALYARGPLSKEDPVRALELVAGFEDPERRDYYTTVIARSWLVVDREAAEAWLQQADIPEPVKRKAYMVPKRTQRHWERKQAADEGEL